MKHKDYSEGKWRVSLGGIENGCAGQVTRQVFITFDRDKIGKAAADRALIQDAPQLAEENERLRSLLQSALPYISTYCNGNDKCIACQIKTALAEKGDRE